MPNDIFNIKLVPRTVCDRTFVVENDRDEIRAPPSYRAVDTYPPETWQEICQELPHLHLLEYTVCLLGGEEHAK